MSASSQPLFTPPSPFVQKGLSLLPAVLDDIFPLNRSHAADLPKACRDLSALLTTERQALNRPYWSSPRFVSAYLRYFLPWNLIRLTALFPTLPLTAPTPAEQGIHLIDLGSGPLTLPLALWLARPDLRRLPITVVATDTSPHIMELGKSIFMALKKELAPDSPWQIQLLRAPLHQALQRIPQRPWLITMGNVLNEWESKKGSAGPLHERMERLVEMIHGALTPGGYALAVEPGTRLGGKLTATLRQAAVEGDEPLTPLAPCSHSRACPMLRPGCRAWCHVNAPAPEVADFLRDISRNAGLDKDSVSLSFVLLHKEDEKGSELPSRNPDQTAPMTARILSEPFLVPDHKGRARYACSERGLILVPDSSFLPSGSLCTVHPTRQRDGKSGAIIAFLPGKEPARPRELPQSLPQKNRTGNAREMQKPKPERRQKGFGKKA